MKLPLIEPLEQRIAPANVNPAAVSIADAKIIPSGSGSATMLFFVSLDQPVPAGEEVVVHYHTADGTALSTGTVSPDYNAVSDTTLTFTAGQQVLTLPVTVNGNGAFGSETFSVILTSAALDDSSGNPILDGNKNPITLTPTLGTSSHQAGVATGTIAHGNALPTISIVPLATVTEGNTAQFSVSLSAAQDYPVTVFYNSGNGTAIAGTDFTGVSNGSVTIPTGTLSSIISISTTDLNGGPGDTGTPSSPLSKTFTVQLQNATLGDPNNDSITASASATGTINDVGIGHFHLVGTQGSGASPTVSVNESAGTISFTVQRTDNLGTTATVDFATSDGTDTNAGHAGTDYSSVHGTLTFLAGQSQQTITIPIIDALKTSGTSDFNVTISNAQNAAMSSDAGQDPGHTGSINGVVTIQDNDAQSSHFSVGSTTVNEQAGTVTIVVNRTGNLTDGASVQFSTLDGTAVNNVDYTGVTTTLNFAALQGQATVTIPILDALKTTGSSQFTVNLANPTNSDITTATGTVTINDTDPAPSQVSVDTSSISVHESDGVATFVVTRKGDTSGKATLTYTTADGGAVQGIDYVGTQTGVVTFAPGDTQETISIPILDPQKTGGGTVGFNVSLSNPINTSVSGQGTATINITDNDASTFHVTGTGGTSTVIIDDPTGSNTASATFTVTRSGDTSQPETISYRTVDGTGASGAIHGTQYTQEIGTVQFDTGETSKTITIPILASAYNGNTQFSVQLSNANGGDIPSPNGVGTVIIDGPSHFAVQSTTVDESTGIVNVTITRSGDTSGAATVDYNTVDGTALAGTDYVKIAATPLTFDPGVSSLTVPIMLLNPQKTGSVQFGVALSNPTDADIATGTGTVTVNDAITNPNFIVLSGDHASTTVTVDDVSGPQGSQVNTAVFTVTRSGDTSQAATVHYTTVNGTAIAGTNYKATTGDVQFAAGDTSETITIPIYEQPYNGNLQFSLQLSNPLGATITTGTGTVVIDGPSHFAITADKGTTANPSAVTVNETDGTVTFTVTRSGDLSQAGSVKFMTVDGTALHGVDYVAMTGTLMFAANQPTQTITVPLLEPQKSGSEQFTIALSNAAGGDITTGTGTVTINDSLAHASFLNITGAGNGNTVTVDAGNAGTATFTVTRSGDLTQQVTVDYTTVNGTAVGGPNYTPTHGTLTFAPNQATATIPVPIPAQSFNGDLGFTVQLSNPQNTAITTGTGIVTIDSPTHYSLLGGSAGNPTAITVNESAKTATFTIVRSGDTTGATNVNYSTSDGTAVAGTDYTATNGTVHFAAGITQQTITIPLLDAQKISGTSQFMLNLAQAGANNGDILPGQGTGTVTINDNDVSAFTIAGANGSPTVTVVDTGGKAVFTVTRTGNLSQPVTINYATVDGTATGGVDYTAAMNVPLVFKANQATQTFSIPILSQAFSTEKQFTVQLSNSNGVALGNAAATVDIEAPAHYSIVSQTVNENAGTVTLKVTRTGDLSNGGSVSFVTSDGTAVHGVDYTAQHGMVVFPAVSGSGTQTQTEFITIPILDAQKTGTTSKFTVNLSNPVDGDITNATGTVTINDADAHVNSVTITGTGTTSTVTIDDKNAAPSSSLGTATFTITRTGDLTQPASVDYATLDGTAIAGTNYTPEQGTVVFAAGVATQTITIPVLAQPYNGNLSFTVQLSNPQGVGITAGTGTVVIDSPTHLAVQGTGNTTTVTVDDSSNSTATITVVRTGDLSQPATVAYTTVDGTAIAGTNYTAMQGPITFPANVGAETITIPIIGTPFSGNEQFTVQLMNPTGADITASTATVIIGVPSHFQLQGDGTTTAVAVNENGKTATYTVTRTGDTTGTATVNYTTSDGTAVAGTDYTATSGTLTFGPGDKSETITIPIIDAQKTSGTPKFNLTLSNPVGADIVTGQNAGTVTITDNDANPNFLAIKNPTDSTTTFTVDDVSGNTATLTVVRTGDLTQQVTVDFTTVDGSAIGGTNYVPTHGILTFDPDTNPKDTSQSQTITVPLLAQTYNGNLSFGVQLSNPTGTGITAGTGTVVIDAPVHFALSGPGGSNTITVDDVSGAAGSRIATETFTVTRSGDSSQTASVVFSTIDGTAKAGTNYTAQNQTLTFAPGVTQETVTIPILAQPYTGNEQFTVQLSSLSNADLAAGTSTGAATVTIDGPSHFSINSPTVNEKDGNATLTVTRTGDTTGTATVDFSTVNGATATVTSGDGSALAGTDFTSQIGRLTFGPGVTSQTIMVPLIDANKSGANEQFFVQLGNVQNADIPSGQGMGTVTILENDTFGSAFTVTQLGTVNETNHTATFTVTRNPVGANGNLNSSATLNFATLDGTGANAVLAALAGTDYTATTGTLTFPATSNSSQTEMITVPLTNNNHHADATFQLQLLAKGASLDPSLDLITTTIHDDASLPTVSVSNTSVTKSTTAATTETFTITLSAPDNTDDITVNFSTADGTAKAGTDYTAVTNQTVTIPKGSTSATITVPILASNVLNPSSTANTPGSEAFTGNLSNATTVNSTNAMSLVIANPTATGTITDNLANETVSVSNATVSASGMEIFTVNLTQPFSQDIKLNYSTADGSAKSGVGSKGDYNSETGTVTIPAGQTTATITVPTNDQEHYGDPLTFTLTSSLNTDSPVPLNLTLANAKSGNATATGTIIEGETITISNPTVVEGSKEEFLVSLSRPSSNSITVHYSVVSGTATVGTNYNNPSLGATGTLMFNPGVTTQLFEIPTLIDPTQNVGQAGANVYYTVQLSNPTSGVTLANANSAGVETATGTILNTHTDAVSISNATVVQGGNETFTVTLAQPSSTPVTLTYTTHDGTGTNAAHAGTDYTAPTDGSTITIPAGQTSATITVPTFDTETAGSDLNFSLQLSNPSSAAYLSNDTATGTIQNSHTPLVSINNVTIVQEPNGTQDAIFNVTISHALANQTITVPFMTVDGTGATGAKSSGIFADYQSTSNTLTFNPQSDITDPVTETIDVPINNSNLILSDRTFTVQLGTPTNASIASGLGTGTGTIHSDPTNTGIEVLVNNPTVVLGAPGTQATETFTVSLLHASSNTITVNYATFDGTALSASTGNFFPDYQSTSGTVTFQPGDTQETISIPVNSYGAAPAKNFTIQLSNPTDSSGASDVIVGQSIGVGTIVNNNALPALNIDNVTVDQKTGMATFHVHLSEAANSNVTFQFQTADGTGSNAAKAGIDYTATKSTNSTPGTILAGSTDTTVSIPIKDLGFDEASNQFSVQLFNPSSNATLGDAIGVGTITHNQDAKVGVSVANVQTSIANGQATSVSASSITFTATLSAAATSDVTFTATPYELLGLGDQTATPGSVQGGELVGGNFLAQSVQVTIPAGSTSATFSFPIAETGNGTFQADHSFGVNFTNVSSNAVAQTTTAIGTILDDGITVTKHQAIWHDIDGDTVTLKVSKGNLTLLQRGTNGGSGEMVFSNPNSQTGGVTLQVLDLSGHQGIFAGANVSVMAQQVNLLGTNTSIGNGTVDVGYIAGNDNVNDELQSSNARDLGFVTVDGDLARIDVGDLFNTPGLLGLKVHSLGADLNTLPSSLVTTINGAQIAVSNILAGGVSNVNISGNLAGQLQVFGEQFGDIGSLHVGGALTGNIVFTGRLTSAVFGSIDGSQGNGEIQGEGAFHASIHSLEVLGSVAGGSGDNSAQIAAPTIDNVQIGSLVGGSGNLSGSISANIIKNVEVGQTIVGGTGSQSGSILANIGIGNANLGGIVAGAGQESGSLIAEDTIQSILVRGSIDGTNAGAPPASNSLGDLSAGEILVTSGNIGKIHVMGNVIGGAQDRAGEIVDLGGGGIGSVIVDGSLIGGAGGNSGSIESHGAIGSATVSGNVLGSSGTSSGAIDAAAGINSVTIGGKLAGGSGSQSGSVRAGLQLGKLVIGVPATAGQQLGDVIIGSGGQDSGWVTAASLGQAAIHGNITGGNGANSGDLQVSGAIGSVTIDGNLTGATGASVGNDSGAILAASIGSILVKGNVTGGDGANSGFIQATGLANRVTIDGNLTGGTGTQSGAVVASTIGNLVVQGNVTGDSGASSGFIEATGQIKQLTIGAHQSSTTYSLTGGTGSTSGSVEAGSIGKALVYGIAGGTGGGSGGLAVSGAIGSIEIKGNLQGGSSGNSGIAMTTETGFIVAGSINSVIIDGDVTSGVNNGAGLSDSGLIDASGAIKSVLIRGDFGSSASTSPVMITAGDKTTNGVALGRVEIDGDINNAEILAGSSIDTTLTNSQSASASIGAILIKMINNNAVVSGLQIAAGVAAGTDGVYGTSDDTAIPSTTSDKVVARIASVVFGKTISAPASADSIEAQEVDSVKTPGEKAISNPGAYPGQEIDKLANFIAFTVTPS